MAGAEGILGTLRILVDADTAKAQRSLKTLGGRAQVAGAVVGAAAGAMAVGALKIGDEYKAATDSIRIGTGATGDDLKALESDFKSLAGRVPDSIGVIGQALADVNTTTGHTGEELQALTESFLDMSRLMEVDVGSAITSVTRMYGDWTVASEDQLAANDYLLRASQATGIGFDILAQKMVQFGAPLRSVGYEMEEGAALLAKWEKEGVNTTIAMSGLKIATGKMAKEGVVAKEGFADLVAEILALGEGTEATALGVKHFGAVAANDMVEAILAGRFEVEDFTDSLKAGEETVQGLSDDTRDFGDAIREMSNRVKVAVGPITDGFAGIAESMGNAIFLLPALTAGLGKGVVKAWQKVATTGAGKAIIAGAGAIHGAIYTAAAFVVGKFRAAAAALWAMMGGGRIVALAAAAGTKAGAAYAAASALAMKAGMLAKGAFAAVGALAGGAFGTAFIAAAAVILPIIAAKMAWDLGKNINAWQGELQEKVDKAVTQPAEEAIQNLENLTTHMEEVQGLGRVLGDTFGGQQQAEGLQNLARAIRDDLDMTAEEIERAGPILARAAQEALSRGNEAIAQEITDIASVVADRVPTVTAALQSAYDPLSSIRVPAPQVTAPIEEEFRLASAAVAAGFGSVKQALANPPQMISKGDRLGNMAKRMKKVMVNIRKATEKDDPMAQRYWEKARAKQQQQIDRLKGKTTSSLSQVKSAYTKAGVSVQGTWTKAKNKTVAAAKAAADGSIAEAARVETTVAAMDLTNAGSLLMGSWATGITAGTPLAVAAAESAAAQVAAVTVGQSPPPKGPLRNIDKGGRNIMDAWLSGFDPRRAATVGSRIAGALSPHPTMAGMGLASAGAGGAGGITIQVGTLIADDRGIDTLVRRIEQRTGMKSRKRQRDFAGSKVRD